MVKFYIGLIAASLFVSASFAQGLAEVNIHKRMPVVIDKTQGKVSENEISALRQKGLKFVGRLNNKTNQNLPDVKRAGENEDTIITSVPEGTLIKNACGTAHGYYPLYGYVIVNLSDGNVVDLVDGDTNFYIKNPFSTTITNSWLKGVKKQATVKNSPDTIEVQLPQPILVTDVRESDGTVSKQTLYARNLLITTYGDKTNYSTAKNQVAKFTWDGDTLRKLGKEMIGLTQADGNWLGYGDDSVVVTRLKDEPTVLPASATKSKYVLRYITDPEDSYLKIIDVAKEGDDFYVESAMGKQNFWAKGTRSGDKVIFPKQYLGIDTVNTYHVFYIPTQVEFNLNDQGLYEAAFTPMDNLTYSYDPATGTMSTDSVFLTNYGKSILSPAFMYNKSVLTPWEDKAYKPQNPEITDVEYYDASFGVGTLKFVLETEDAEGHVLDAGKLFYKVYFGDENHPYTFTKDKYKKIGADMTEVPATYSDGYDFSLNGTSHTIYINEETFSDISVGIQAIYKGGDEVMTSEIAWYGDPSGIKSLDNSQTTGGVAYYDLSGRRVTRPAAGLYIKTVKLSDGTVRSTKVIK